MNSLLLFLIKSTLILSLLYLAFSVLMRKETFFQLNRMVLLVMVFSSMLIPFLYVPKPVQPRIQVNMDPIFQVSPTVEEPVSTTEIPVILKSAVPASETVQPVSIPIPTIVIFVYLSGVLVSFLMFVYSIGSVLLMFRKARKTVLNGIRIRVVDHDIPAFSFGRNILISQHDFDTNYEAIITHEQSHIRLGHFYDLMLMELVKIIFWFNPLVYRMVSDLKAIHEFQADDHTLHSGIDAKQYQILIIQKCVGHQKFALANSFNHCQIKNRITMMNKQKTSKAGLWKVATFLPLLALLLMFCGRKGGNEPPDNSFQLNDQNIKLDQCFLLFEGYKQPFKFEMDLVGGSVDENYNFEDTKKVKQLIWLTFTPKQPCWLTDGEYKFSAINTDLRPWMSFQGTVRVGEKKMNITGGDVICKRDSDQINITVDLIVDNGQQLKGTYNGQYSDVTRVPRFNSQPNLPSLAEIKRDSTRLFIEMRKDGYYMNNKLSSFDAVLTRVRTRGRSDNGNFSYKFTIEDGMILSEKRNQEWIKISEANGIPRFLDTDFDKAPVFPGGTTGIQKWIVENLKYPKEVFGKHIQGMAHVDFIVNKDGKIVDPRIIMGIDPVLDIEALRVVAQMPLWEPAISKGLPVDALCHTFIKFDPK